MGLLDKLGKLVRPTATPAATVGEAPSPHPEQALPDDLQQWVRAHSESLAGCDQQTPANAIGSSRAEIADALAPFFTLDRSAFDLAFQGLTMCLGLSAIHGRLCGGFAACRVCGNYVAPMGSRPGVHAVTCTECRTPVTVQLIEYSLDAGRYLRELVGRHAHVLAAARTAAELHERGESSQAAAAMLSASEMLQAQGHLDGAAGAMVRAGLYRYAAEPVQGRRLMLKGLGMRLQRQDVSGAAEALHQLATLELGSRPETALELVLLVQDMARSNPKEHHLQATRIRSMFLEACLLGRRASTSAAAIARLSEARRYLAESANEPGGQRLLRIEADFTEVLGDVERWKADPAELMAQAAAAIAAERFDEADPLLAEAAKLYGGLGDFPQLRVVANQQVMVSLRRGMLAEAFSHTRTMEYLCRHLEHRKDLALVLRNQAALLELGQDPSAEEKRAEAERIDAELKDAERTLAEAKERALTAEARGDAVEAIAAWGCVREAALLLENPQETFRALQGLTSSLLKESDHAGALYVLLEAEGLCRGSGNLGVTAISMGEEAELWTSLGNPATGAGRLARATCAAAEAVQRLSDSGDNQSRSQFVVALTHYTRRLRLLADQTAAGDVSAAERYYRLLVDAVEECLTRLPDNTALRFTHLCNLDELGAHLLRHVPEKRQEGMGLVRRSLQMLDELNEHDPAGASDRAAAREEILEHLATSQG